MSDYERPWPAWSRREEVLFIYLHSREFELSDVAQIVEYKLHRPARNRRAFYLHMVRINQDQVQRSLPTLCDDGIIEWNRAAVDNFLIHSTNDADSLQSLLWFHRQYIPLLRTWHDNNVPLNEVLDVDRLQMDLAWLIRMHRSIYPYPSWRHGGCRFR